MNINYLNKLEFNKILEILSTFCSTYVGKDLALNLQVSNDKNLVKNMLAETEEAVNLVYRNSTPSFYDISDINIYLKSLESYMSLSAKALLDLANIFKLSENLKDYFNKDFIDINEYPKLNILFSELYSNKSIQDKIFSCIIDENTIDDKASSELDKIRKRKRHIEQDIRSKLNNMIHSSNFSKYLQENLITIRNDRFVIPIKEEYRSQVKGFVHDVSNAGSTLFIEPIVIFEMNNELNQLRSEEEIEIEKILQNLTKLFFPYVKELENDVKIIGHLDFIFAKAKYSKSLNCITPKINDDKYISLINARHPLIDKSKVVPISVNLGKDFSTLLITGPNTGGKTVSLKTVGLLTCMACCGLNIPADENSSIFVFDNIFADIGDDQSIADSLSTFSAHMTNIVDIVNTANSNSLILVDELGSGTDPLEGANLAISILANFKKLGALTIATTHYQELKKYALTTEGFQNASVEFDVSTLSPTYRLLIGVPGKSNAFEISRKLGLSDEIINDAQALLSKKDIDFETLLKSIYDDKAQIEKEKLQISEELAKTSELRKLLEEKNHSRLQEEQNIINNAKVKARNILLEAKEDANEIIKEMASKSDSKSLDNLRNSLNKKIKDINIFNPVADDVLNDKNKLDINDIKPNLEVFISSLGKEGIVLSFPSKSNQVQVQIGSMKMNVDIKYLRKIEKNDTNKNAKNKSISSSVSYKNISKSRNIKTEINILGLTVDEAISVVDKFLDDCSIANLQTVRIIHGKGTGKLKNGIHQFLKSNSHVKNFRLGSFGEGEMGVTVVELK
ncbi:MAG: endonuclease MutS2 [Clostridia bacterium]|nr:endonuclease MutS2 [Clostridium sp.]